MKTDFFSITFLEGLPSDDTDALYALCEHFAKFDRVACSKGEFLEDYLEIHSILDAFAQHRGIESVESVNASSPDPSTNILAIRGRFQRLSNQVNERRAVRYVQGHVATKKKHYSALFSGLTTYEFSETDYQRIQVLITQLRELIVANQDFSEEHRTRLLKRLEAMQGELHKKTSDIDRFWGFIGEVGINMRKFGENMKPISDRVRELAAIVIAAICTKEGIPLPPEGIKALLPDK